MPFNLENTFLDLLSDFKSVFVVLFDSNGDIIYQNEAFRELPGQNNSSKLLSPKFEYLYDHANTDPYEGLLTIGSEESLNSTIYCKSTLLNHNLLIIGENQNVQLAKNNILLAEINRKNSNLQRALIKEKSLLEIAQSELKKSNKNLNLLLGTAAHDLRNPIGVAHVMADFLAENINDYSKSSLQNYLNKIKESTHFALELLNSLLDTSAIQSGDIQLNKSVVKYSDIILHTINNNKIFADKKSISINLQLPNDEILVKIDPIRIRQLLNNLISNGLKYSPPNTAISIIVVQDTQQLITKVYDQGPGISKDQQSKLFDPFTLNENDVTGNEKASGLGLAISQKVVQLHGGKLWVDSEKGMGSCFSFTLPLLDQ